MWMTGTYDSSSQPRRCSSKYSDRAVTSPRVRILAFDKPTEAMVE